MRDPGEKSPRPRVLFVGSFPPPGTPIYGGNLSACARLVDTSLAEQADIVPFDTARRPGESTRLVSRLFRRPSRFLRFIGAFHASAPDAVLVFSSSGFSLLEKGVMVLWCRLRGTPSLLWMRDGHIVRHCQSVLFRWIARRIMSVPDLVLAQSESWREWLRHHLGVTFSRSRVIENWVAPELLEIGGARSRGDVETGPPLEVVFMGDISEAKGVMDLVAAVERLSAVGTLPDFVVRLAGTGPAEEAVRAQAREAHVTERIDLVGYVAPDRIGSFLSTADVFVLPSRAEGFPNALVEAMACGLACVGTRVGAIPDAIVDGVSGLVVESGDVQQLASALERLLSSASLRSSLGAEAYAAAADRFLPEKAAGKVMDAIDEVARKR